MERRMVTLANHWAGKTIAVDYLVGVAEGPHRERLDPAVTLLDLRRPRVRGAVLPLTRYLRARRPDAIVTGMARCNVAVALAVLLSRVDVRSLISYVNAPVSLTEHGPLRRWLETGLNAWAIRRATAVVCVSEGVRRELMSTIGPVAGRSVVISGPSFDAAADARSQDAPEPPVPRHWSGSRMLVGIGRLAPQKDFETLIRAVGLLRQDGYRVSLVILGEGQKRRDLERLVSEQALGDWIRLPGFVRNPYPYLRLAACFVLSSRWEGFPNVLVEALAVGVPVVSTDCPGGPRELLMDGRYGILCPVSDAGRMAAAIREALGRDWDRAELRARAGAFGTRSAADAYLRVAGFPLVTEGATGEV